MPTTETLQTPPIQVSEQAAEHVRRQLETRGRGLGIRLGVRKSGCSGMAYALEFVDEPNEDDLVVEQHGTRFFVHPDSLVYLRGAELQFVREGVNEGLRFANPNVSSECGCGESFDV